MKARRVLFVALAPIPFVLALPGAASAEEPEPESTPSIVAPVMTLSMVEITNGTRVCVNGTAPALGTFLVSINGVRSNGSQISYNNGSATTSFADCEDISKSFQPSGTFDVAFVYEGGQNTSYIVRPHSLTGVTAWGLTGNDTHIQTT